MMAEQWTIKTIGELCSLVNGGTPKSKISEYWGGEVNWITPAEMGKLTTPYIGTTQRKITELGLQKSSAKLFPPNSVILSTRAPIGHLAINTSPMSTNQGCKTLVPNEELDHKFLYYFLQFNKELLDGLGTGTTFKELSGKNLKGVQIPIPPLSEQRRIVSILDEASLEISKSIETMNDNLRNTLNLLTSTREKCFTPQPHWIQSQLDELCQIKHGFAFKSEFFSQSGDYVLLTPGNFFETGGYRDRGEKQKFYTGDIPEGYVLSEGNLLVAMTEQAAGLLGSPIIVSEDNRFLHNQRLGLIKWNNSQTISNEFVFHFFNTSAVRQELHNTGTGIKVRHTSPTKIGNLLIAIPPNIEEQQAIAEKLNFIEKEVKNLGILYENKTTTMNQLKQSILQEAFSGKLTGGIAA